MSSGTGTTSSTTSTTTTAPQTRSPMVTTSWLAERLDAPELVLLDATVHLPGPSGKGTYFSGRGDYFVEGHIPGAVFADLMEQFSDPDGEYPFTAPSAAAFEEAAGSLGIGNDTTVVVYDNGQGQCAARLWWLFRAFGYDRVGVLDGGLTKWRAENRAVERGFVTPDAATFVARPRPDLWVDRAYVEDVVAGRIDAALVCGLHRDEYLGERAERPRGGHIPGSTNVAVSDLVDPDTHELVSSEALTSLFGGVMARERIVVYCGQGLVAAADALALTMLGHRNVAIYDNSMNEWSAIDALPIATSR